MGGGGGGRGGKNRGIEEGDLLRDVLVWCEEKRKGEREKEEKERDKKRKKKKEVGRKKK